jgi:hypothetical protein
VSVQPRADVSIAETDEGMVLLDQRSGRYWQLNSSGALVLWRLFNGATLEQAAETLTTRYPVSRERASSDVAALVASLRAAGLVSS